MRSKLDLALASFRQHSDATADIAVILGSGLGDYAHQIEGTSVEYAELDGFPLANAPSHQGKVHIGLWNGRKIVAFQGRFHLYEGHSPQDAAFPIEFAQALGVKSVILTNISGSLNPAYKNGDIIGLSDHIYFPGLTGQGTLVGRVGELRSPFVNLTKTYDMAWRQRMKLDQSGIYACLAGPHFETPAEGRMLRTLGADMVGMSTIHEAVLARYFDMKVLGLSLVVNPVITNIEAQSEVDEATIWKCVQDAFPRFSQLIDRAILTAPND